MARYGNLFEAAGAGLGEGLAQGIPGAMAYSRQRKDKLADLEAQRQYLGQQKQDQMDFMDRASRQRMAEALLAQTNAPAGDIMEALPVASSPSKMDQLREYLSRGQNGLYGANRGLPGPVGGRDRVDSMVNALNVAGTLGMKRQHGPVPRTSGRPWDVSAEINRTVSTRNQGLPLHSLRPITDMEARTMLKQYGLTKASKGFGPVTHEEEAQFKRLIGTSGG